MSQTSDRPGTLYIDLYSLFLTDGGADQPQGKAKFQSWGTSLLCVCAPSVWMWCIVRSSWRTVQALSCRWVFPVSCLVVFTVCRWIKHLVFLRALVAYMDLPSWLWKQLIAPSDCSYHLGIGADSWTTKTLAIWSVAFSFVLRDVTLRINWQSALVSYWYSLHAGSPGLVSLAKTLLRCVCRCRSRPSVGPNPEDDKC